MSMRRALILLLQCVAIASAQHGLSHLLHRKNVESQWRLCRDNTPRCAAWNAKVGRSFEDLRPQLDVLASEMARNGLATLDKREAYDLYLPTWSCESRERVPRRPGDGPKWMCGVDALRPVRDCLVYSVGSNGDASFERALKARQPHCEIFTFDPTLPSRPNASGRCTAARLELCPTEPGWKLQAMRAAAAEGVTTLVETGLGSRDGRLEIFPGYIFPVMTLPSLMKSLGHENRTINVLKIDIEGGEYEALVHETLFGGCKHRNGAMPVEVEQLQLELHGIDARPVARLFAAVYACGLQVFNSEPNHWGCDGYGCVEFSFVGPTHAFRAFRMTHPSGSTHGHARKRERRR